MRIPVLHCSFLTCVCLFASSVCAQQQMGSFMAYGPETKYFANINYRAFQSKNGYLWFGTGSGLVRFDGRRYKNFFSDYADPNSPSDNVIFDITEDKNGYIWFAGFYHGATRYNQRTGEFRKYPVLSKDKNPYYGLNRILNDAEGNLWLATSGRGLARYLFEKDSFEFYYPQPNECRDGSIRGFNHITDIEEDKTDKNILWLGTFNGLYSFDKRKKEFTYYIGPNKNNIAINSIQQDKNNLLWIGTWGDGLKCFEKNKKQYNETKAAKKANIVYELTSINDSIIYAACLNSGLYELNIHTGSFSDITPPHNPVNPTSQQPDIQKVSVTADAGVLIGGNYYVYQQHPDYVRLKTNAFFPDKGLSPGELGLNACIWDASRQQYWLASNGGSGIYKLDKDLHQITALSFDPLPGEPIRYFYNLANDAMNRTWVMNYSHGIYTWNDQKQRFVKPVGIIPLHDTIINKITKICSTNAGNLWMIAGEDFIYWDVKRNKTETYPIVWDKNYNGLHTARPGQLHADPNGNAWLFTQNGMFNCKREEKKVNHIYKTGSSIDDLASPIVMAGAFNKHNDLWITSGNGIQVINWKDYTILSNHDLLGGLPSMLTRGIVTDTAGRVWASLASGLGLFDTKTKAWQLFNRLDGLEKDYLDNQLIITSNNKLFITQQNGFLVKDINELLPVSKAPLLRITSISINKDPYIDSLLPEFIPGLDLPYNKNNIDIEFGAMDWIYPFKTTYRFRIEGLPSVDSWNNSPEASINLTAVPPGVYILHIQALNGNGVWSKEIVFPITIRPPFWKTWWFITLCILMVAALIYMLYRYRINQFIKMQKVRNTISRDLHDEIGATLSSVNMLSAVALLKSKDNDETAPIIQQIKNSVQRAGESIDDIVWSVNPANDLAQDTFARIRKYVTELTEAKGINCIIQIDEPGNDLKLPMELRRDIYLVSKEAVNNAFKYSGCTTINVTIHLKNKQLLMKISDNGAGFDTAILNNSSRNGISNMRHRVEKHRGIFELISEAGKGTTISCRVPV